MSHVMARIRIASLSIFPSDLFQAKRFGFALTAGHGDRGTETLFQGLPLSAFLYMRNPTWLRTVILSF